jgi:methionyl-tRNA formyltransferase
MRDNSVKFCEQQGESTKAPKIDKGMSHIKFSELTAKEIWGRWRALTCGPGVFSVLTLGNHVEVFNSVL